MWQRVFHFTKFCLSFLYQLLQLNCLFLIIFVWAFTQPVLKLNNLIFNWIKLNQFYLTAWHMFQCYFHQWNQNRKLTIMSSFSWDKWLTCLMCLLGIWICISDVLCLSYACMDLTSSTIRLYLVWTSCKRFFFSKWNKISKHRWKKSRLQFLMGHLRISFSLSFHLIRNILMLSYWTSAVQYEFQFGLEFHSTSFERFGRGDSSGEWFPSAFIIFLLAHNLENFAYQAHTL